MLRGRFRGKVSIAFTADRGGYIRCSSCGANLSYGEGSARGGSASGDSNAIADVKQKKISVGQKILVTIVGLPAIPICAFILLGLFRIILVTLGELPLAL